MYMLLGCLNEAKKQKCATKLPSYLQLGVEYRSNKSRFDEIMKHSISIPIFQIIMINSSVSQKVPLISTQESLQSHLSQKS